MSYRQGSPYDHRRDSGRFAEGWAYEHPRQGQPQPAHHPQHHHPQPRRGRSADYTLTHAGRQVRLGPVAFWITVGSLVVMAGWSVMTGTYFAFHDDVLKRLIARQAEMQFAYEDRIAELRAQVDRITSRQLLDQEQFEHKLDQLVRKQATLESRATTLSTIGADPVTTGSVKPNQRQNIFDSTRGGSAKPSPINDTVIYTPPPDREARLESRVAPVTLSRAGAKSLRGGVEGALIRMQDALDRLEAKQTASLSAIEESYDSRARRMRGVLADLGIDPGKPPSSPPPNAKPVAPAGIGGPYVPASISGDTVSFDRQLYRIGLARAHVDKLNRTLAAVPVRKPVLGEIDMSSPFGMRMDPFVKGPAIHSGIDMRGDTGDPVRATATGIVTIAGVNGGYGKMVEIDHGNGLSTRFGHMSAIDVNVGQSVRIGQTIGKIGSTGRSTGPHLHYETRVDGDAVDPQKYLRAGVRLGAN